MIYINSIDYYNKWVVLMNLLENYDSDVS